MSLPLAATLLWLCGSFSALAAEVPGDGGGLFHWRPFLAPFHSVALHLPIGFVAIAFALELRFALRGGKESRQAIHFTLGLSLASCVVTIALGLLRGQAGDYNDRTLELHKWFGVAVGALTLAAFMLQRRAASSGTGPLGLYRLALVCDLAALVAAGHYGGNLTHGSDYLLRNAPGFLRGMAEGRHPATQPGAAVGGAAVEILKARCAGCHNEEKSKGRYRLDTRDLALTPGRSGKPPILPGKPLESLMVEVILLPPDDELAMPPGGKPRLTDQEAMAVIRWIREGAPYPGEVPPPKTPGEE